MPHFQTGRHPRPCLNWRTTHVARDPGHPADDQQLVLHGTSRAIQLRGDLIRGLGFQFQQGDLARAVVREQRDSSLFDNGRDATLMPVFDIRTCFQNALH